MRREFKVPVNLVNLSSDPASGAEGDIYYNTTSDVVRLYANGTWTTIGAGGGSASDSFKTIAVSGQDNVVADSSTDTLTLIAGTNVSITTNATTDSITINSAGTYTNVDSITYPDFITFDTTPETTPTETGSFYWDSGESAPGVILNANVDLKLGQEQVVLAKNATGSSIPKGSVVYINGAAGQRPTIALSDADTEVTSSKTLGVTAETLADGAEGFVTTFGVLRGVNTDGLTEGAALWLSSTAGRYTTSIPAEPAHSVFIGYVVKANASSGEIFVNPQNGYELDELHGVTIEASGSLTDNEVLAYDLSSGLWKNQTASEAGLAVTAGTLAQFASTTSSQLAGVISDETGSGSLVFATSPSLTTPTLGVASATSINKVVITAPATGSILTIADGKTLTASNTLTFTGTDGSTLNIGTGGTLGTMAYETASNYALLSGASFTGNISITNSVAANIPFTITAASSQSGDITQWKNSGGTNLVRINSSGSLLVGSGITLNNAGTINMSYGTIGSSISGNMLSIRNSAATERGITIRAHASQSVNLQEWQDSSGTILSSISSNGGATFASLTVTGDLTVNGTTTTINSTTITVDDKNIELGSVASPTDTTADGGGITLKGTTDKTIVWDDANDNWTSSEHWNIATNKVYKINNTEVLSATTLGSGITNSSITKVGLASAGFVKSDVSGNLSVDTAIYLTTSTASSTYAPLSSPTFTGVVTVSSPTNNAIEIGRTDGTASTPYIDFHAGATAVDYDARIIATSGNGSIGGGNLSLTAATITLNGDIGVNGGDLTTSAGTFNLINTNATTINFASDGTAISIGAATGTTTFNHNVQVNGNLTLGTSDVLIFEGSSDDANETTLTVTNPTADRTITLPDVTGTVITTGNLSSITSTGTLTGLTTSGAINLNYASPAITSDNASAASIFTSNVTGITIGSSTIRTTAYPSDGALATAAAGIGFMGMPIVALTASGTYTRTFQASDSGKTVYVTGTPSSATLTIDANGTLALPVGTTIVVINDLGAATNISIAITTDTLQLAGTGSTGTRTLARYGMATMVKVTSTKWIISGNGLT